MPYKDKEKQQEALKRYYQENKELITKKQRDRRTKKRKFIQGSKKGKKCTDCGIAYPFYMMDYDHARGKKIINLAKMYKTHSLEDIKKEIEKCDLVCANCHRHRTWKRSIKAGVA